MQTGPLSLYLILRASVTKKSLKHENTKVNKAQKNLLSVHTLRTFPLKPSNHFTDKDCICKMHRNQCKIFAAWFEIQLLKDEETVIKVSQTFFLGGGGCFLRLNYKIFFTYFSFSSKRSKNHCFKISLNLNLIEIKSKLCKNLQTMQLITLNSMNFCAKFDALGTGRIKWD